MQTYTIANQQLDLKKLINEQENEPIILKNNSGKSFLLMPFSENKMNNIFLMLYKSFEEMSKYQDHSSFEKQNEPKMTAKEFTNKWLGFMKDTEIPENYKEEYSEFLNKKYQ